MSKQTPRKNNVLKSLTDEELELVSLKLQGYLAAVKEELKRRRDAHGASSAE